MRLDVILVRSCAASVGRENHEQTSARARKTSEKGDDAQASGMTTILALDVLASAGRRGTSDAGVLEIQRVRVPLAAVPIRRPCELARGPGCVLVGVVR